MKHFLISLALALSLAMTVYGQANSTGQTVTLSNAVAVSGNGNSISTERWGAVRSAVTISASDTVSFEVFNGTAWTVTKNAFNVDAPTTAVNGATVSGTYIIVTNGMPFRAPVTHVSGTTTVTATQIFVTNARAVVGGSGGSSLPVADTTSIVTGSSDVTKIFRFEADTNIPTGTTIVGTLPAASFTFAGLGLSQTFSAPQTVQITDSSNLITTTLTLAHRGTDAPDVGFGASILLQGNDVNAGSVEDMAQVAAVWSDASSGSEDSDVTFQLRTAGSALAEKWRFSGLGRLTIAGSPTIAASAANAGITLTPNGSGNLLLSSGLLQSGGTNTSAFALKNNVGEMQLRLADDSAFGNMAAQAASFYQGGNRLMVITALSSFEQVSLASGIPLWWSNSATSAGGGDVGLGRLAAGVLKVNDGSTGFGWIVDAGVKRVSTQFDKTDTTLANITGLSVNVQAGRSYSFETILYTTSNIAAGVKAAIGGTATATAIIYEAETASAGVPGAVGTSRTTTLGTAVGDATAVTVAKITIRGTIVVNAAGTLTVQFAENVTNASASSVLVGSSFVVRENP